MAESLTNMMGEIEAHNSGGSGCEGVRRCLTLGLCGGVRSKKWGE